MADNADVQRAHYTVTVRLGCSSPALTSRLHREIFDRLLVIPDHYVHDRRERFRFFADGEEIGGVQALLYSSHELLDFTRRDEELSSEPEPAVSF